MKKTQVSSGFSLIEAVLAALIVTVALIALLGLFGMGVQVAAGAKLDTQARDQAQAIIESIFAARNGGTLTFPAIQNVSADPANGVFTDGMTKMWMPGADGIPGTKDDDTSSIQTDPAGNSLSGLQRQILIQTVYLPAPKQTTPNPNVRSLTVSVQYNVLGKTRTYTQQTYISTYR